MDISFQLENFVFKIDKERTEDLIAKGDVEIMKFVMQLSIAVSLKRIADHLYFLEKN